MDVEYGILSFATSLLMLFRPKWLERIDSWSVESYLNVKVVKFKSRDPGFKSWPCRWELKNTSCDCLTIVFLWLGAYLHKKEVFSLFRKPKWSIMQLKVHYARCNKSRQWENIWSLKFLLALLFMEIKA